MMRWPYSAIVLCWLVTSSLAAQELRGSIRKWDASNNRLTIEMGGKSRDLVLPPSTPILDARGERILDSLLPKAFQPSISVRIQTEEVGTMTQAKIVRLRNYYLPRPDEFYLDPAKGGADFLIQGEYEGAIEGQGKLGAQVVAVDDAQFSILFIPGGLPGAGMEPKAKTVKVAAATKEGTTSFAGVWKGQIAGGKLTGTTNAGKTFALGRVVRKSPTLGAPPPKNAVVLFDGSGVANFPKAKMSADKLLQVSAISKQRFKDFQLHVEFQIPFRGPSGGNSGVYLQNCYEIQVFDSLGSDPSPSGCGGIYVFRRPDVNMSFPPLSWQTFDVDFTAAKFAADGKMEKTPVATVRHNGVVIHDSLSLPEKGNGGRPTVDGGPLFLQAHGSPVRYRNIWVVER